jgi:hypothetical protein
MVTLNETFVKNAVNAFGEAKNPFSEKCIYMNAMRVTEISVYRVIKKSLCT